MLTDCTYTPLLATSNDCVNISNYNFTSTPRTNNLHADDVVINGKSLSKTLESVQERLAILDDPSPEKLKKYTALKKAYEHYKLLEKLLTET